jgi:hypothetical protein
MKRTKNSRKMHMVFNVQSGAVEVKVHENEFTVHRGGVWQVPRGESHFPILLLSTCTIFSLIDQSCPSYLDFTMVSVETASLSSDDPTYLDVARKSSFYAST